jgi:zinc/manganese transport system substrate-binding protein
MGMILICFLIAAVAFSGCGDGDGDGDGIKVVATTDVAADIARQVAGPDADVETLVPTGASAHDFGASAKDRAELEDADLVVAWGAGLEAGLPLDDLPLEPLELADGQSDPHVWMNPAYVALNLSRLTERLVDADPAHADAYRRRAAAYSGRLINLDRDVRRLLNSIPPERRKLVTSHDSLGHLARRYGLEFVGAPFGTVPESAPSADAVADLIERVRREHVPAVFAEATDDPEVLKEIAREADVEVVDDLLVESFGGEVDSYEEMLRHDAQRIAGALAP